MSTIHYTYLRLNRLRFWCNKILPLVYDDALSYYEVLAKVVAYLNRLTEQVNVNSETLEEVVNTVNGLLDNLDNIIERLDTFETEVEEKFNALEDSLSDKIDEKINEAIIDINKQLADKLEEFEGEIDDLISDIDNLKDDVNNAVRGLQTFKENLLRDVDRKFDEYDDKLKEFEDGTKAELNERLEQVISQIIELQNVQAIDPIDGKIKPLDNVLDNLYKQLLKEIEKLKVNYTTFWDNLRVHSVTVDEYKHLKLTVEEYKTYIVHSIPRGLTVTEYATRFKDIVRRANHRLYVFSSKTGAPPIYYKEEIKWNTDLVRMSGAYTASEYDSKGFRVWDLEGYTAQELDWRNNRILTKRSIPNI